MRSRKLVSQDMEAKLCSLEQIRSKIQHNLTRLQQTCQNTKTAKFSIQNYVFSTPKEILLPGRHPFILVPLQTPEPYSRLGFNGTKFIDFHWLYLIVIEVLGMIILRFLLTSFSKKIWLIKPQESPPVHGMWRLTSSSKWHMEWSASRRTESRPPTPSTFDPPQRWRWAEDTVTMLFVWVFQQSMGIYLFDWSFGSLDKCMDNKY